MENKDLKCFYSYILHNIEDKDIKEFISYLQDYVYNGSMVEFEGYCNSFLDIAMREEVRDILSNMEDKRLAKMSDTEFNELADTIAYRLVYKAENVWEHISEFVSWEVDSILESEEE